jgi:hypothetical protein
MKRIIDTGYNEEKNQWWTEFEYNDTKYFIIWEVGIKDNKETFDVGIFPSSLQKEKIDGPSKRTVRKKSKDETGTRKNEKSRS